MCGGSCRQIVCERSEVFASVCAIARAFPLYSRKSCSQTKRTVNVEFVLVGPSGIQSLSSNDLRCMCDAAEGVRMAARITDMPCADMHTDAFIEVGCSVMSQSKTNCTLIRDTQTPESVLLNKYYSKCF